MHTEESWELVKKNNVELLSNATETILKKNSKLHTELSKGNKSILQSRCSLGKQTAVVEVLELQVVPFTLVNPGLRWFNSYVFMLS